MDPKETHFSLCATYEAAARAANELSTHDTLILDCEGRDIGMPDGALSIIAIGDSSASRIFLFDTLALSNKQHPLLAPLFSLLRRPDIVKLVWDGRSDFFEIADTYGVLMEGVLDLQIAEVVQRSRSSFKKNDWRGGHTPGYFKKLQDELQQDPTALDGIHRLFGLTHCAGLYQLLQGSAGKDPAVVAMHREDGGDMWMQRPLAPALVRYSAHDIELIASVYARFRSMKKYLGAPEELKAVTARYLHSYPTRELRARHARLDLCKFLPLDVLSAPPPNTPRYRCDRCERMLSSPCFSTTDVHQEPSNHNHVGQTKLVRLSYCRLCHLLARRNSEVAVGDWIAS